MIQLGASEKILQCTVVALPSFNGYHQICLALPELVLAKPSLLFMEIGTMFYGTTLFKRDRTAPLNTVVLPPYFLLFLLYLLLGVFIFS